jgi:beta-glucanase (GH16 family)
MTRVQRVAWLLGTSACLGACNAVPEQSLGDDWSGPRGSWVEVWRDDFDGELGAAPDASKWTPRVREHGQNAEQDYDTARRENSFLDGQGYLVLRARAEHFVDATGLASEQPYTSARLDTRGKLEPMYGKLEARIQLPRGGKGVWPAFWLLGANAEEVRWPACGEVDILEMKGSAPSQISGSLHGPGYSGSNPYTRSRALSAGNFGDDFHVFALEWTAEGIRWLVDGRPFHVRTPSGLAADGKTWVFDHPFYIIVNLAIGGLFDGNPDEQTAFPQDMTLDYVSVSRLE